MTSAWSLQGAVPWEELGSKQWGHKQHVIVASVDCSNSVMGMGLY